MGIGVSHPRDEVYVGLDLLEVRETTGAAQAAHTILLVATPETFAAIPSKLAHFFRNPYRPSLPWHAWMENEDIGSQENSDRNEQLSYSILNACAHGQ
jgi:hypothetical protein